LTLTAIRRVPSCSGSLDFTGAQELFASDPIILVACLTDWRDNNVDLDNHRIIDRAG